MEKVTAIVVARGGSVRLPNKAMLPFGASTLIGHKVKTLLACETVGRVVVGSDSDAILNEAFQHGADCICRSARVCDETVCTANEMIADMIRRTFPKGDGVVLWAHPTNPLVRSETYDAAVRAYQDGIAANTCDSLMSVTEVRRHCWNEAGEPMNFNPWAPVHVPASGLPVLRFQDGAIFIQTASRFAETRYFYGQRPALFPVPWTEGWDIDTADDMRVARCLCG